MKYFPGFWAWRAAFWALMEEEQPEEVPLLVSESCLPDNHYYASVSQNAPKARLDLDAGKRLSQKRKAAKDKKKATRASKPAKN